MFGKEQHSRESFEEAEKAVEARTKQYKEAGSPVVHARGMDYNPDYTRMLAHIKEAEKRLETLKAQGHKEAQALNERYDELKEEAAKAAQALAEFEKDKLGMHEKE
jgi:epoxyqueuosine reductase QueG